VRGGPQRSSNKENLFGLSSGLDFYPQLSDLIDDPNSLSNSFTLIRTISG
jgi:hypothetical protein